MGGPWAGTWCGSLTDEGWGDARGGGACGCEACMRCCCCCCTSGFGFRHLSLLLLHVRIWVQAFLGSRVIKKGGDEAPKSEGGCETCRRGLGLGLAGSIV